MSPTAGSVTQQDRASIEVTSDQIQQLDTAIRRQSKPQNQEAQS
jgi:hypothetical protein